MRAALVLGLAAAALLCCDVVSANLGVFFSGAPSSDAFTCFKKAGYNSLVTLGYSNGALNDQLPTAAAAMIAAKYDPHALSVTLLPCPTSDGPTQLAALMQQLGANNVVAAQVWLFVTTDIVGNLCSWPSDTSANCNWMTSFAAAASSNAVPVGVYASAADWQTIMGASCSAASTMPLWYFDTDGHQGFKDFAAFGGWSMPAMKTYNATYICQEQVNLNVFFGPAWPPYPPPPPPPPPTPGISISRPPSPPTETRPPPTSHQHTPAPPHSPPHHGSSGSGSGGSGSGSGGSGSGHSGYDSPPSHYDSPYGHKYVSSPTGYSGGYKSNTPPPATGYSPPTHNYQPPPTHSYHHPPPSPTPGPNPPPSPTPGPNPPPSPTPGPNPPPSPTPGFNPPPPHGGSYGGSGGSSGFSGGSSGFSGGSGGGYGGGGYDFERKKTE